MRKSRFTYEGAYHHIVSRAHGGVNIFGSKYYKDYLLNLVKAEKKLYKISVFAYCIMDNHYHLVLQNTSGKLSMFMQKINTKFAVHYRKREGGKGYVFQDRYYSSLIGDETYLRMAIVYVLLNPVRAGIISNPQEYSYSSLGEYFTGIKDGITDRKFVESIFGTKRKLFEMLQDWEGECLPNYRTKLGDVLGDEAFYIDAVNRFNRREGEGEPQWMREDDRKILSLEEVLKEFEKKHGIKIEAIDVSTIDGKRLRGELLVRLKDDACLTYREIKKITLFRDSSIGSLSGLYNHYKRKRHGKR